MALSPGSPELSDDEYNKIVGLHKPGSIKRVRLTNFLTYNHVEFECGPRLNMIIGANGTGKSSILCAFVLGLGGNPKDLGRADDARHFIMHDQPEAVIEIELEPHKGEPTHIFKRTIQRDKGGQNGRGASSFFINDEKVPQKAIKELVTKKYHIAVDNLCQFLPQDRVGNFSGFGPQDLLIETEKSMSGSGQLYEIHQALIEMEADLKKGGNEVNTIQDKLRKLEKDNEQLEREKERMEEREEAERQLRLLESKFLWLKYDALREAAKELKTAKDEAKAKLKTEQEKLQPLEQTFSELSTNKQRFDSRSKTLDANMKKAQKEQEKQYAKHESHLDKMEEAVLELDHVERKSRQAQENLAAAQEKLENMEQDAQGMPSEEDIKSAVEEAQTEVRRVRPAYDKVSRETKQAHSAYKEMEEEKKIKVKELSKMNDEKVQRKRAIFQAFPELGKICEWLDNNKAKFRRPVWGPVACEITTKSNNAAAFLEYHVPNATLKAFVVETKDDYDLLYKEVRGGLKLPINILVVNNGVLKEVNRPYSENKMRSLKKDHGVIGYLDESFTAPNAILQALRNASSVHTVLVGASKTQSSIDNKGLLEHLMEAEPGAQAPNKFSIFASKGDRSFRYQGNLSRYSKKMAMSQDEIRPPRLLKPGVNPERKKRVEEEIQKMNEDLLEQERECEELRAQKDSLEKQVQEARGRLNHVKETKKKVADYHVKLKRMQDKIRGLEEQANSNDEDEKKRLVKKVQAHMTNLVAALEAHADQQEKIMEFTFSQAGVRLNMDANAIALRKASQSLEEAKRGYKDAEDDVARLSREFTAKKNSMKEAKNLAEKEAPLEDDEGRPLPLKAELEALSVSTIPETEAAMEEANAKVNGIEMNADVIRQYEERKREIEEIRATLSDLTEGKNSKLVELNRKRAPWEQSLEVAVAKVNEKFSEYMKRLDCAGEVKLKKGSADERRGEADSEETGDFKSWGIEIRVKFREGSKLQALSARVQSGGERSVSTIMYLMALQDHMSTPVRSVDEINQGLDERNERLVFDRIVQNATKPPEGNDLTAHSGQYFLITPKLLPNLFAMEVEAMTVLVIFNGPHGPQGDDWDVEQYITSQLEGEEERGEESDDDDEEVEDEDENSGPSKRNSTSARARKQRRLS